MAVQGRCFKISFIFEQNQNDTVFEILETFLIYALLAFYYLYIIETKWFCKQVVEKNHKCI